MENLDEPIYAGKIMAEITETSLKFQNETFGQALETWEYSRSDIEGLMKDYLKYRALGTPSDIAAKLAELRKYKEAEASKEQALNLNIGDAVYGPDGTMWEVTKVLAYMGPRISCRRFKANLIYHTEFNPEEIRLTRSEADAALQGDKP